jgi:glutathione S-transferase
MAAAWHQLWSIALTLTPKKETDVARTSNGIRLHRFVLSGHSHRVQLFLSLLGLSFEMVDVDLRAKAHKTPEFLAKNPLGQVPVLEDGDIVLADSNAILVYLAMRYDPARQWLSDQPAEAARVQRWLSIASGELAAGPNAARLVKVFGSKLDYERAIVTAEQLFGFVDTHLRNRRFLAADHPTIADVAIYSYTAKAWEGGLSLHPHADVRSWLARVEALSGFVPMASAAAAPSAESR